MLRVPVLLFNDFITSCWNDIANSLLAQCSRTNLTVVGLAIWGALVHSQGKWAEPIYKQRKCHHWPQGPCGYSTVRQPVAKYVTNS